MKTILLTFDLEEFDLPRNYGIRLTEQDEFDISKKGLKFLSDLLSKYNISATFFTTTNFAKKYPKQIRELKKVGHEIASHGLIHSDSYIGEDNFTKIKKAKQELEKITKTKIKGFRAPRLEIKNISKLNELSFIYDSSLHPVFIPGRYFNLFKPRKTHKIGKIIEIPLSTLPFVRLPIFWLAFKNFPLCYSKIFTKINFGFSDYTMLISHPWEFVDLSKFKIPRFIKGNGKLLDKLENYIKFCKNNKYIFRTVEDHLNI